MIPQSNEVIKTGAPSFLVETGMGEVPLLSVWNASVLFARATVLFLKRDAENDCGFRCGFRVLSF